MEKRPLKICFTCKSWSTLHKGFCHHLKVGTGKFWSCKDWEAVADSSKEPSPQVLEEEPE